jgi:THO complex subunit 1
VQNFKSSISQVLQSQSSNLSVISEGQSEAVLKLACDQALRETLYESLKCGNVPGCLEVIQVSLNVVKNGSCNLGAPFILLEDVFDCLTVPDCEQAFSFVEGKLEEWRSPLLLTTGKNYLLRMCNNLLRRLSTLRNTVFCGRIQLFLAQLFPLDEKSALNIMGAFNLDNVTIFGTDDEINEENFSSHITSRADDSSGTDATTAVDYALYKKFWGLQDFFRNPNQCYERKNWLSFVANANAVLAVFSQHKLDDVELKSSAVLSEQTVYFPKNLTSEKLFDLQIGDTHFRRHFLIQLVILFQYITTRDVKFKTNQQVVSDEMTLWINKNQEKVYALLEESPPNGAVLVQTIKHVLGRESIWNAWKNESCPSFLKKDTLPVDSPAVAPKNRSKRATIADDCVQNGGPSTKRVNLGSAELTRLWNIDTDNMRACRAENRSCFPQLEKFFEEAAEQLDPEAGIEDEYKLIFQPNYQWRSLRLLARKSSNFFQPSATVKTVPEFLKIIIDKTLPREVKQTVSTPVAAEPTDASSGQGDSQSAQSAPLEDLKEEETASANDDFAPSESDIEAIASNITDETKKYDLAVQLDFKDDEIENLKKESNWEVTMINQWVAREGTEATIANLVQSLIDVGLHDVVHTVYPKLLPAEYRPPSSSHNSQDEEEANNDEQPADADVKMES